MNLKGLTSGHCRGVAVTYKGGLGLAVDAESSLVLSVRTSAECDGPKSVLGSTAGLWLVWAAIACW